jgi:hypothetical protein
MTSHDHPNKVRSTRVRQLRKPCGNSDQIRSAVDRDRRRERALEILRNSNWKFPAGWKFDREAANQREDAKRIEDGQALEDGHSHRSSPRGHRRAG